MKKNGFTLIELIVVIAIMGIAAAIAIPGFSRWLPDSRLKSATRDVYSNMQSAKLGAIKENGQWALVFNAAGSSYQVVSGGADGDYSTPGDNIVKNTTNLTDYGSGVGYGPGNATDDIPKNGAPPADNITYGSDVAVFNSRGTCNAGYVYLENNKNTTTYGVGTRSSGIIRLLKWDGASWG
mgnify:CR=1 FL=1